MPRYYYGFAKIRLMECVIAAAALEERVIMIAISNSDSILFMREHTGLRDSPRVYIINKVYHVKPQSTESSNKNKKNRKVCNGTENVVRKPKNDMNVGFN